MTNDYPNSSRQPSISPFKAWRDFQTLPLKLFKFNLIIFNLHFYRKQDFPIIICKP